MKRCLMPGLVLVLMITAVSTCGFANAAAGENDVREKLRNEGVWLTPEESAQQKAELDNLQDSLDNAANMLEKLKAPQLQVQVNGSMVEAPPYMSVTHGQVMVPLRWSAELLGATSVDWDATTRTVTITTPQDFYSMEKYRSYATALNSPVDEYNDKIWPLPDKAKDMEVPNLVSNRHWVLNLKQFNPERVDPTLPTPRDNITINVTSDDRVYEHSSVANSLENHQGNYYLPMDWLEYLFNARVIYNEVANILFIQTPDPQQVKSEIERIENALIPDSADDAIQLWGRGMQTRNGGLQYAALSPQLRQEADQSPYVRQSYWVTGCSSPQVGPITIESRNELSDTKIEYTLSFPEIFSGQTHAIATEKMVVEKLPANGLDGWFITQILQSSGYGIIDEEISPDETQKSANSLKLLSYIEAYDVKTGMLTFDEIEWVTHEDTERVTQLGLDADLDFPNGFYVYNEDGQTENLRILEDVKLYIVDWDDLSKPSLTDVNGLTERMAEYQAPYHLTIEDGVIVEISEQYRP